MSAQLFTIQIQPEIPQDLKRLQELAGDLYYSWSGPARRLFRSLDSQLWRNCGHNPTLFLKRISQKRLIEATDNMVFMETYQRVLADYDNYLSHTQAVLPEENGLKSDQLVAYFCLEFGFHESLPIYSGGLGILAGDHCKASSDLRVPLVAVGLMYHQGYFTQHIDRQGNQIAAYEDNDFGDLPLHLMRDEQGQPILVNVPFSGRDVVLQIWKVQVGHVSLFLLDSDLDANSQADRELTRGLYAGDRSMRISQEMILGIGGVRALRRLDYKPDAWHINEGHAAFMIIERAREVMQSQGFSFEEAIEWVAAATVFTTHTPVPAGHDIFAYNVAKDYLENYAKQSELPLDSLLKMGINGHNNDFNMTALALRGSRFHNGVSKIHGGIASRMEHYIWPEIEPEENPLTSITNGVHLPTYLSTRWQALFDSEFGREWRSRLLDDEYWSTVYSIPDFTYWSTRLSLKADMFLAMRRYAEQQFTREGYSQLEMDRLLKYLNPSEPDVLVLGFARRFATYKRATLLLRDKERLRRLLNNPERPVVILFAGKAHPADQPGQALIKEIYQLSMERDFQGKLILLENYNQGMARWLVSGVDVWLNTPEYPMEASGTSGEKAAINGVLNLSVLDGWWDEGFDGENGWGIKPYPRDNPDLADSIEAQNLLDILEEEVIPLYYEREHLSYSLGWIKRSMASMRTMIPNFNASRMVKDYVQQLYSKAVKQGAKMQQDGGQAAKELTRWKQHVRSCWPSVGLKVLELPPETLTSGDEAFIRVEAKLAGLKAQDVRVECQIGQQDNKGDFEVVKRYIFNIDKEVNDVVCYRLKLDGDLTGLQSFRVRAYPWKEALSHPLEMGLMRWV